MNGGQSPELMTAALSYAARGWRVFPLHSTAVRGACTCYQGFACANIAKHPRLRTNWREAATSDPTVVRGWWHKWPLSNIAVLTGSASGVLVVDVDDKNGKSGTSTLAALARQHAWEPKTLTAATGSGRHLYFRMPEASIRTRVQGLGEGLDVKADGGYVVAPPSIHASFNVYRWEHPQAQIEDVPRWLVDAANTKPITAHSAEVQTSSASAEGGMSIPEGERNATLFKKACGLRGRGFGRSAIEAILQRINAVHCDPSLSNDEVAWIARRASKYSVGSINSPKEQKKLGR